jgi:hypothetical protein
MNLTQGDSGRFHQAGVTFKLDLKKTTAAGTVLELTQLKKAS